MSIFSELLPKIVDISNTYTKNFNDCLEDAIACIEKFEQEVHNESTRERTKDKHVMTTLQSINENDDEPVISISSETSTESTESKRPKKRSKDEVDWVKSPEVEKRQKRNASIKAQTNITKHVNVNLTQKLRRNGSIDKTSKQQQKEDNKENAEPVQLVQVKLEKISLPPEPMDMGSITLDSLASIPMKQEPDEIAMPPPNAPMPKPRKALQKQKSDESSGEESSKRTSTRTRKQTESTAQTASSRSLRASSRAKATEEEVTEAKPRRTRTKKVTESTSDNDKNKTELIVENGTASPVEKPRPKRTRRGQNAVEKEQEKQDKEQQEKEKEKEPEKTLVQETPTIVATLKEERVSEPVIQSPVLQVKKDKKLTKYNESNQFDKTKVISEVNGDQTLVLPNSVYDHDPVTPKNVRHMNETVVIEKCNETFVLDKPNVMNGTVVIEKAPQGANITEDNSLITDDSDTIEHTPPNKPPPQPTSAVKERVQQFEEMATRVTRTKTRAMAKKEEPTENQTPPDKVIPKTIISTDTLTKMNNMIFNGKTSTTISSASKPRITKSQIPQSTGKLSTTRNKEEAQEDARRKKEALLEAKREQQRRKREEKMAAAAAAREAAERERKAIMEAALKERLEKQAHVDLGKIEKLKEVERKKQELARKVAETEERRKAEEQARQQKLAEEQKRAGDRKKQLQEAEANKKEAALMEKEMERRQREFMERQKMKQRMEGDKIHTPFKYPTTPLTPLPPVHMADGFEFLVSDEEAEPVYRPPPSWSTTKTRTKQLVVQAHMQPACLDKFFNVRIYSPDLREIFPNIERKQLKRTSSAVWRTPPTLRTLPVLNE